MAPLIFALSLPRAAVFWATGPSPRVPVPMTPGHLRQHVKTAGGTEESATIIEKLVQRPLPSSLRWIVEYGCEHGFHVSAYPIINAPGGKV